MSVIFKFFLQDTKSSNGTFVNNVRLSKGSEESEPKQIKSGDIVQFGVDVVENSKKGLYVGFLNSLIIHEEKTKEITTVKEVWMCDPNYHKIR